MDKDILYFMKPEYMGEENKEEKQTEETQKIQTPEEIMAHASVDVDGEVDEGEEKGGEVEEETKEGDVEENTEGQSEVKEEGQTEEVEIGTEVEDILKLADELGGEENQIDEKAEKLEEAVEGGDEEEILKAIQELETELQNATLEKEQLEKEKQLLLSKLQELQDKLSEYEINNYEYKSYENVFQDPNIKGFLKILAIYKSNPDKIPQDKVIEAFDRLSTELFGVSISDTLKEKAQQQKQAMTGGEEKQPVEVELKLDEGPSLDDHLNQMAKMMLGM